MKLSRFVLPLAVVLIFALTFLVPTQAVMAQTVTPPTSTGLVDFFALYTPVELRLIGILFVITLANFLAATIDALAVGGLDPVIGGFDPKRFPEFFTKQLLHQVLGFALFIGFSHYLPAATLANIFGQDLTESWTRLLNDGSIYTVFVTVLADLAVRILRNLTVLFGLIGTWLKGHYAKAVPPKVSQ